jgi:hypothetical protein
MINPSPPEEPTTHNKVVSSMDRTPAGILIPQDTDVEHWIGVCTSIAEAETWDVIALVHTWEQMRHLLCDRRIDIGLVGRWAHLPRDRRPRVVVAEDYGLPSRRGRPPGDGGRPVRLHGRELR